MSKPISGLDPVRSFPYYKLQFWEERVAAWMDVQQRFASRDDLIDHAREHLEPQTLVRIVIVEDYGRRRILEECGPVSEMADSRA